MAGSASEDNGVGRSSEGISSGQRCQSGDSLSEWRSCEQVENGTPSTSPPYWDTDEDDDCGAKPSELYGKFTWKIENYSQISKRELRSNAFEVGGYKWYILIYPQGCDVCNHLSLFLCVANHDKLLPGWSHFAQFTIAVVNKDPKKSKYSDTLHRFWKKEHDWGWKKFMELSKINDGFVVSDTLVIKAQVQVIREKAHRPFRCLDCQYRRELVRVYLSNVELICRRFVEERRGKLGKLIEDKVRWSSFCAFWLGIDQNARRRMSRDKKDAILKVVVKHFFIEKEVTSTLVMDSLYSGLKALECQSLNKKGALKFVEMVETPAPIVFVEKDMFVLADDVLVLLERAAVEPLPPKDDKGPQNRTKDGSSGDDFNKDSIERDEKRLTELGRRTVEIFVLAHIFSNKIEVAYQEAVALKRQEELIREEEALGQAENELRAKRRAAEKEKRAKKKQSKQKRSSRKGNDTVRDEKSDTMEQEKKQQDRTSSKRALMDFSVVKPDRSVLEKPNAMEDVFDVSDTGDDITEMLQHDLEERHDSPVNWDTDTSEIQPSTEASSSGTSSLTIQNGGAEKKNASIMDDSSSTCSTDSVPSVIINRPTKGKSLQSFKSQTTSSRGKIQGKRNTCDPTCQGNATDNQQSDSTADACHLHDSTGNCRRDVLEAEDVLSLKDRINWLQQHLVEKEEEVESLERKLNVKDLPDVDRTSRQSTAEASSSPSSSPTRETPSSSRPKQAAVRKTTAATPTPVREASMSLPAVSKPEVQILTNPTKAEVERPVMQQGSAVSRPSSAPGIPALRPNAPVISMVQTTPLLSRSMSAAGRLGTDPSPSTQGYRPQSYRNAITGKTVASSSATFAPRPSSGSSIPSPCNSQLPPALPIHSPQAPARKDQGSVQSGFTFGSVVPAPLHTLPQWVDSSRHEGNAIMPCDPYLTNSIQSLDINRSNGNLPRMFYSDDVLPGMSTRQAQGPPDDFPHLDIINYLFDEELSIGKVGKTNTVFQGANNRHQHPLNRQFTFPDDSCVADASPAANCCRFDRSARHANDGIGRTYNVSGGSYDGLRDVGHEVGLSGYMNGQMDGMIQNQWQLNGPDLSLLGMGAVEGDGYPFLLPDYSNLPCGVNGYSVFRPARGH